MDLMLKEAKRQLKGVDNSVNVRGLAPGSLYSFQGEAFFSRIKLIHSFQYFLSVFFKLFETFSLCSSSAKPSATSATLELDKLMASLSDFRVQSSVRAPQNTTTAVHFSRRTHGSCRKSLILKLVFSVTN